MKVLFSHSYFLQFDTKQLATHTPFPPLATLYAAAVLRENEHEVALADLQFSKSPDEIEKHLQIFKPDVFVIYDDGFNYLTKMCLTNMRDAALSMLRFAKESGVPTIVSSSDATDHVEKYLNGGADFVIIGEAEKTLLELVQHLQSPKKNALEAIDGLAYLKEGNSIQNKPRQVIKDLDELPWPAWDLINIEPYKQTWLRHHGYFSINFVTTRGCPYKCNWCAKPIYGNRYNSHSPKAVALQIRDLQKQVGFTHVWFADDIFGLKPNWLKEFSSAMQTTGTTIKYKIQSRADLLLEDENISYLAQSGCVEVWMGAESGSQKVLDAMDKGTSVEQIKIATDLLKKHGIKPCFFLQFGYSGENINDIKATLEMLSAFQPHDIGISVSYPLPGTKFYEKVKSELQNKQNWKDSDDLDMMFNGTYSGDFYKVLQRYVHYSFRTQQSQGQLKAMKLNKRTLLGPYYFLQSKRLKAKLQRIESDAKSLF